MKKVGHRHVRCAPPQHEKNIFFCLPHHNMLTITLTTDEKKVDAPTCFGVDHLIEKIKIFVHQHMLTISYPT